jgi:CRISPR-associated protein Cmr4
MFQAQQLVFYNCLSPVHMGAGTAIGAIDNPIQREVHTQYPVIAGSGLKGAVRHHFNRTWQGEAALIKRLFGPDTDASDHAGAIAFTDAQLVAFPVRSLKNTFVYATSPIALARLKRLAGKVAPWAVPDVAEGQALVASTGALSNDRLVLEAFDFDAKEDAGTRQIADWLSQHGLPAGAEHAYFRSKMAVDLVVLGDTEFSHFVRHATVVEAHVRINDSTGTADDGGLFYTENLPPESLLAGLVMASVERQSKKDRREKLLDAEDVLAAVLHGTNSPCGLAGGLLQVGGDATTGRGLIAVHAPELV